MRRLAVVLLVVVWGVTAARAGTDEAVSHTAALIELQAELTRVFGEPKYDNAHWGVRVEADDGEVLFDLGGGKQMMPASNMKLLTTAAALAELGPDFTYETALNAVGEVRGGVLDGDLVIVGSGDPSFGAWHPDETRDSAHLLANWVMIIKQAGIRRISGGVVGDGRIFTEAYYSPHWTIGDLPHWYATGSSGLAIEENAFRLRIRPGARVGLPAVLSIEPHAAYIELLNETVTVAGGGESDADITWRSPKGNVVRIGGSIALDSGVIEQRGSVWDGARYAAYLLTEALAESGVQVAGAPANIRSLPPQRVRLIDLAAPQRKQTVAVCISAPLSELVKVVNKPSHNFFADQLLRTLGATRSDEGSFEGGAAAVRSWMKRIGAPQTDALSMHDGSGLARRNQCQPRQITAVLRHMYGDEELRDAFVGSLSVAGDDGTMGRRMRGIDLRGAEVRAKTGYIGQVRSLSGYVIAPDGGAVAFSMICNFYTVPTADVNLSQDRACAVLAHYLTRDGQNVPKEEPEPASSDTATAEVEPALGTARP